MVLKLKSHYVIKLQILIANCDKNLVLEWVPAHVGIHGNTLVDARAKEEIYHEEYRNLILHYYDIKTLIRSFMFSSWQLEWRQTNCWLQRLKPKLGDWKSAYRDIRREEIVLSRLRTGMSLVRIKHYIDANTPIESCLVCNVRVTIYHLFLQCPQYNNFRREILSYLESNGISESVNSILNDNFPGELLFKFLKDIHYYNKI